MEQTPNNDNQDSSSQGFRFYAHTRILAGVVAVFIVLWLLNGLISFMEGSDEDQTAIAQNTGQNDANSRNTAVNTADLSGSSAGSSSAAQETTKESESAATSFTDTAEQKTDPKEHAIAARNLLDELGLNANAAKGVVFIHALIQPMNHELRERWWGWRPNDIINVTDNVNNFQLGVLELTRRTTVILTDRISRSGSTDALDKNLEEAMNGFMISADRYWFPSAESKYKEGLDGLAAYAEKLQKGQTRFYHRTDNLIPLLRTFEDLLGSCSENLNKVDEADGSRVSHFMADDYFYYAKGVATSLHMVLQAVAVDFKEVLEVRRATSDMHLAIEYLQQAMDIEPIYITNADFSGILANHRANMAAPINHSLSYLQVVITALST